MANNKRFKRCPRCNKRRRWWPGWKSGLTGGSVKRWTEVGGRWVCSVCTKEVKEKQ